MYREEMAWVLAWEEKPPGWETGGREKGGRQAITWTKRGGDSLLDTLHGRRLGGDGTDVLQTWSSREGLNRDWDGGVLGGG